MPESPPNRQQILELMNGFRPACIIGAAAELDLWTALGDEPRSAEQMARQLGADLRATTVLLDAVTSIGLLQKHDFRYSVPLELRPWLVEDSPETILPMLRHAMNISRCWSQLAQVTRSGRAATPQASICGAEADRAAFIAAMHVVSGPMADDLVQQLGPLRFHRLLDVGGASGTWTLAFLRAIPTTTATIFDLPDAIEQARCRLAGTEFASRVSLVAGDFYDDELPGGADLAWVSAICHQHSRRHNRELFAKVFRALVPGGRIALRDVVMEPCRSRPCEGALFAVNMLVNTESGGTFTFEEFAEDLQSAGFENPRLAVKHESMNSVVVAEKP
jgi:SAM-dependent methyltransferase